MRSFLQRGLIWTLAIALMVAGLPLAHAQNCDTLQVAPAQHAHHHAAQMDAPDETAMDHAAMIDQAPLQERDDGSIPAPCKCLNCSSLCAVFVAPMPNVVQHERRTDAIVYAEHAAAKRDAALLIDPGIPIAL